MNPDDFDVDLFLDQVFEADEKEHEGKYILFTREEYDMLIVAFLNGQEDLEDDSFTEADILEWIRWCERAALDRTLVDLVLKRVMVPYEKEDDGYNMRIIGAGDITPEDLDLS